MDGRKENAYVVGKGIAKIVVTVGNLRMEGIIDWGQ